MPPVPSRRPRLRALALAAAAGSLAAALALGGAAPAGASIPATAATGDCSVAGGSLTWGFKESFRSYVSGTIARGSWQPSGGATYETPLFSWPAAAGSVDPATGHGTVSFEGAVTFTGHDGLLETTIADPTLVLDEGGVRLLLDVTGVTMEDAMAGGGQPETVEQVPFVVLDVAAAPVEVDGTGLRATDAPSAITDEGFGTFPNYEPGTPFDAVSFAVDLSCATEPTPAPTATATAAETDDGADDLDAAAGSDAASDTTGLSIGDYPWVWWAFGAAAVVGVGIGVLLVRRARASARDSAADPARDPHEGDEG